MKAVSIICILLLCLSKVVFAAPLPASQNVGSTIQEYVDEKQEEKMARRLSTPKSVAPALDAKEIENLPDNADSIYIREIIIQKVAAIKNVVSDGMLSGIITDYTDRSLSFQDMKMLADDITKSLSSYGIKAYVPQQSFLNGVVYINIVSEEVE